MCHGSKSIRLLPFITVLFAVMLENGDRGISSTVDHRRYLNDRLQLDVHILLRDAGQLPPKVRIVQYRYIHSEPEVRVDRKMSA